MKQNGAEKSIAFEADTAEAGRLAETTFAGGWFGWFASGRRRVCDTWPATAETGNVGLDYLVIGGRLRLQRLNKSYGQIHIIFQNVRKQAKNKQK